MLSTRNGSDSKGAMNQELSIAPVSCHRCFLAKSSKDHVVVVPSGGANQEYHRLIPALFRDVSTISTKSLLKLVQELSNSLTEHSLLMRLVGTPKDGLLQRSRMCTLQCRCCQMAHCLKAHFVDVFRGMETLSQPDVVELGKSLRIYMACLHSMEQELLQTAHLFQLFPLHSTPDGSVKAQFVHTGTTGGMEQMFSAVCESLMLSTADKYRQERESWKQLAKLTMDIRALSDSLHTDAVLGSMVDYVIFNPDDKLSKTHPPSEMAQSNNLRLLGPASATSSEENLSFSEEAWKKPPMWKLYVNCLCFIVHAFCLVLSKRRKFARPVCKSSFPDRTRKKRHTRAPRGLMNDSTESTSYEPRVRHPGGKFCC
ncbi:uncharacterized protein [Dermacentor albipictus]|uniref:uncharacterized protein isoform X2 n=1 Tax=Dermacentor albipictus TaxID=60249 RepID=UPI0031FBF1E7